MKALNYRLCRFALAATLFASLCVFPFLLPDYRVFQLTLVLIYAIAIIGLNLLTGDSGQVSLGHGAFVAIGAYVTAVMVSQDWANAYASLPIAALFSFLIGICMGFPALRLAGHYLALATYALALAVPQLLRFRGLEPWTGGVQGIVLSKLDPPWAIELFGRNLSADGWLYLVCLALLAAAMWLALNLVRGRVGRALLAIREHPAAATAMGVNLASLKTLVFGVSAAYTGLAGGLSALVVAFVSPDSFTVFLSITLLVGAVVGGLGSIWATLAGAVFVQFVPNLAESLSQSAPWAVYGVILIALMFFFPGGLAGFVTKLRQRRRAAGHALSFRQPDSTGDKDA